jgi:signal-transduction protein with cAMP-binding, CBS, and nucleotidyltransferase domain
MIKKVKLLQLLSEREVEELASACSLVAYAVGDTIIKQGEYGETFYMLKSGEVAVSRDDVEVVRLKQVTVLFFASSLAFKIGRAREIQIKCPKLIF